MIPIRDLEGHLTVSDLHHLCRIVCAIPIILAGKQILFDLLMRRFLMRRRRPRRGVGCVEFLENRLGLLSYKVTQVM